MKNLPYSNYNQILKMLKFNVFSLLVMSPCAVEFNICDLTLSPLGIYLFIYVSSTDIKS